MGRGIKRREKRDDYANVCLMSRISSRQRRGTRHTFAEQHKINEISVLDLQTLFDDDDPREQSCCYAKSLDLIVNTVVNVRCIFPNFPRRYN